MPTGHDRSGVEAATAAGAVAGLARPGRTVCLVVRESSQTQQAQARLPDVGDSVIVEMRTQAEKRDDRHSFAAGDHTRTARAAARTQSLVPLGAAAAHRYLHTAAEDSYRDGRMAAGRAHAAAGAAAGSSAEVRDSEYRPTEGCGAPDCCGDMDPADRLALA